MRIGRFGFPSAIATLLCFLVPIYGHAILLSATPRPNQVLKGPDLLIKLKFNARIDTKRSRLLLLSPDGKERTLAISEASSADELQSKADGVTGGSYVLRWQVLAGDGHISRGEVPFRVQ